MRGFGTGVFLVGIFRRAGVVCQIFHRILSRAWRALRSMHKRYSLAQSQYPQRKQALLDEDLHGPRSTFREARSRYHHSCCAAGSTTISSETCVQQLTAVTTHKKRPEVYSNRSGLPPIEDILLGNDFGYELENLEKRRIFKQMVAM